MEQIFYTALTLINLIFFIGVLRFYTKHKSSLLRHLEVDENSKTNIAELLQSSNINRLIAIVSIIWLVLMIFIAVIFYNYAKECPACPVSKPVVIIKNEEAFKKVEAYHLKVEQTVSELENLIDEFEDHRNTETNRSRSQLERLELMLDRVESLEYKGKNIKGTYYIPPKLYKDTTYID